MDKTHGRMVTVLSGGLDSATLAYKLRAEGWTQTLVSFDYGQRHRRELAAAGDLAERLDAPHHLIGLGEVGALLSGSALTDTAVAVPEGHYTDASMRATVVPNRNAILLAVATGIAVVEGATAVGFGAHAGDHPIYPDCRPAFVEAFTALARIANEGFLPDRFRVVAPFIELTKTDIVRIGDRLGVPFEVTWSCYQGRQRHCGRCGSCTERREAFTQAGVPDPTPYE